MCCDGHDARPEETVGQCPECDCDIDEDGESTEQYCNYSPVMCSCCGLRLCDQSC
jgi:hypothetical protein